MTPKTTEQDQLTIQLNTVTDVYSMSICRTHNMQPNNNKHLFHQTTELYVMGRLSFLCLQVIPYISYHTSSTVTDIPHFKDSFSFKVLYDVVHVCLFLLKLSLSSVIQIFFLLFYLLNFFYFTYFFYFIFYLTYFTNFVS